jgi:hypothetical protein
MLAVSSALHTTVPVVVVKQRNGIFFSGAPHSLVKKARQPGREREDGMYRRGGAWDS